MLTLLLTLILNAPPTPETPGSWSLSLSRSGGFTGGNFPTPLITIFSESASEELNDAVRKAEPQKWTASYAPASNPSGCCDQFKLSFELRILGQDGEARYRTHWYQASYVSMPPDLVKILRLAQKHRTDGTE